MKQQMISSLQRVVITHDTCVIVNEEILSLQKLPGI